MRSGKVAGVVKARHGYDMAADAFATWHWTEFWKKNESPIVRTWLAAQKPGLGLDAGSGHSPYGREAIHASHRCVGLDLSANMLRIGEAQRDGLALFPVQGDISAAPFQAAVFDWVLITRVLSHISTPAMAFEELGRVAKPGAPCLITDVHPDHPYEHMSIDVDGRSVAIETYKHRVEDVVHNAEVCGGFRLTRRTDYRLVDLDAPPSAPQFEKILRRPELPIFYVLQLRRQSASGP